MKRFVAAVFLALGLSTSAFATPHVDFGGSIFERLNAMQDIDSTGAEYHISGVCISACTMYLGLKRVCVESGSILEFHSAGEMLPDGRVKMSRFGNDILMAVYPENVRQWIIKHNALSSLELTGMTANEAFSIGVKKCGSNG